MPVSPHSNEELEARYAELMNANPEQNSGNVQVRLPCRYLVVQEHLHASYSVV